MAQFSVKNIRLTGSVLGENQHDYIEFFYNPQRKQVRNGMMSPIAFEQQQKLKLQGV
jgi:hypothetical protein